MTAFFFSSGLDFMFTIMGIVIILWFFGQVTKSALGIIFDPTLDKKQIHLKNERSADGKLVVRNVKRSIFSGFYSAEIVDAETGQHVYSAAARDIDALDNRLASELDWWSRHPVYKK